MLLPITAANLSKIGNPIWKIADNACVFRSNRQLKFKIADIRQIYIKNR